MFGTLSRGVWALAGIGTAMGACALPPLAASDPPLVFIAGQSNAEGQDNTSSLTDSSITAALAQVRLLDWAANVSPYTINYDTSDVLGPRVTTPYNMGTELTLGRAMAKWQPWIVKQSIGNTSIQVHWLPTGTYPAAGAGNLANLWIARMLSAIAQSGGTPAAVVWIQGEADAADATAAANYQTNLTALINHVRASIPGIPWVIVRLNNTTTLTHKATVRAAQDAVALALPNVYSVDVDDIPTTLHYSADQLASLGTRLGAYAANAAALWLDPVASFSRSVTGLDVTFTNGSSNPNVVGAGSGALSYAWDFGDGTTSTSTSPSKTYAAADTYTVSLTVTTPNGYSASTSQTFAVSAPSWSIDAASGKGFPANATEWTSLLASAGLSAKANPSSLHLLQEASGNAADSIGSLTLTAVTSPLYSQAVSGMTRVGVGFNEGTNQRFVGTAGDASTTSCLALGVISLGAGVDATVRGVFAYGASVSDSGIAALLSTSNRLRLRGVAGLIDTAVGSSYGATAFPFVYRTDHANTIRRLYTDDEKVSATYGAGTSATNFGLGALMSGTSANFTAVYLATWFGAAAEGWTDADVKALLQALGWTIPWS